MNRQFGWDNEDEGYAKLEHFNEHFLNLQGLTRMPKNYPRCDASGITTDGTDVNVEIKVRNQILLDTNTVSGVSQYNHPYTANTIFIEAHKAADLLIDYIVDGNEPIYVNFIGEHVVVFNLRKLKRKPSRETNKDIYSKLYEGKDKGVRYGLPLEDAFIYRKTENNSYILVRKP